MKDVNKVMFTGRLGADPEMRYTAQGTAVTSFRAASNRQWRDASGEKHEEAEWFKVVAWDKLGEICNEYLNKGSRVYVEGRLQTRKYQDKDGQDRYMTEVVATDMVMLDGKNGSSNGHAAGDEEYEAPAVPAKPAKPAPAPASRPARATSAGASAASRDARRNAPRSIDDVEDLPF
jgi:single-strand DNA-binding protein